MSEKKKKRPPPPTGKGRKKKGQAGSGFDEVRPVSVDAAVPSNDVRARTLGIGLRCEGGMGEIWNAVDANLRRRMIKKRLKAEWRGSEEDLYRLVAEAQVGAQLDHPNIPAVHDLGIDADGNVYVTMQLVRGHPLNKVLESDPRDARNLRRHLRMFLDVCSAIAFAHSRGVINRDIKPENVVVGDLDEVTVLDWGVARLLPVEEGGQDPLIPRLNADRYPKPSEARIAVGTAAYMSPEQAWARIDEHDERTDVFGLGAVLYRILAGRPPYQGESTAEKVRKAQCQELVPARKLAPPFVPDALCEIAQKAMAEKREDRFQTVLELRTEVERVIDEDWSYPRLRYRAGSTILKEGDPGDAAYLILEGRCRAFRTVKGRRRLVGRMMGAGDCFGEVALFSEQPRSASVEAVSAVRLLAVPAHRFDEMDSWLAVFVKALARRFREKDDRILELEQALGKALGRGP